MRGAFTPPKRADVTQQAINTRVYSRSETVGYYARHAEILPTESSVVIRYRDEIMARPVLDLGCGAGRLAAYLQLLAPRYVGVDVSPHMIAHCRRRFPALSWVQGDMRELARIADGSVGVAFAVSNLIDAVGHDDRLRVLAQVRRVLVPGGLFLFSTHNRNWMFAGAPPRLQRSRRPLAQLRNGFAYAIHRYRNARLRRFEQLAGDHAVLNDEGHGYSVLHYYITRTGQQRQLAAAGFTVIETFDGMGRPLDIDADDREWSSLLYVARS
jgi:SAM-dependent methyltransferase